MFLNLLKENKEQLNNLTSQIVDIILEIDECKINNETSRVYNSGDFLEIELHSISDEYYPICISLGKRSNENSNKIFAFFYSDLNKYDSEILYYDDLSNENDLHEITRLIKNILLSNITKTDFFVDDVVYHRLIECSEVKYEDNLELIGFGRYYKVIWPWIRKKVIKKSIIYKPWLEKK